MVVGKAVILDQPRDGDERRQEGEEQGPEGKQPGKASDEAQQVGAALGGQPSDGHA